MKKSIFDFSAGLGLVVLAVFGTPAMAQDAYPDTQTQTESGGQQFGSPGGGQQSPVERRQGMDSSASPDQQEMQVQRPEAEMSGARGPIRSETMSGNAAADRGYEGFLQFQERRTNTP